MDIQQITMIKCKMKVYWIQAHKRRMLRQNAIHSNYDQKMEPNTMSNRVLYANIKQTNRRTHAYMRVLFILD